MVKIPNQQAIVISWNIPYIKPYPMTYSHDNPIRIPFES
jgi:hypothetical protein